MQKTHTHARTHSSDQKCVLCSDVRIRADFDEKNKPTLLATCCLTMHSCGYIDEMMFSLTAFKMSPAFNFGIESKVLANILRRVFVKSCTGCVRRFREKKSLA